MISKYKPIVDYVEGKTHVCEFQKLFNSDSSLQRLLKQRMNTKYGYLKQYDYTLFNALTQNPTYANRNWNSIHLRSKLQLCLMSFLDNFGVKYTPYAKYGEEVDFLLDIQPSWLFVLDDTLDSIVYEIPADLPKTKRIAMGKAKIKEMFHYDKTYPRWVQEPEWPIVNGKPLVFSHQQKAKGDDFHFCYYFYNPDTKEETIVEQFG